jgi:hypothetical protein
MRFRVVFVGLGALLVALTFTFPLWFPLLQPGAESGGVAVAIPGMTQSLQASFLTFTPEQQQAYLAIAETDPARAIALIRAALQPPIPAPDDMEGMPSMVGAVRTARGTFQRLDPIRWAQGDVSVYQQADDSQLARFENFSASNAPDLRVLLAVPAAPTTMEELGPLEQTIDLGQLVGTVGNQNYQIPTDVDLADFFSIVLYSPSLNLIMSYATL